MSATKPANQDWQRCGSCGTWWPVDTDFVTLGVGADPECPRCHLAAPFAPAVAASWTDHGG